MGERWRAVKQNSPRSVRYRHGFGRGSRLAARQLQWRMKVGKQYSNEVRSSHVCVISILSVHLMLICGLR